jgi:hypothetical protein
MNRREAALILQMRYEILLSPNNRISTAVQLVCLRRGAEGGSGGYALEIVIMDTG